MGCPDYHHDRLGGKTYHGLERPNNDGPWLAWFVTGVRLPWFTYVGLSGLSTLGSIEYVARWMLADSLGLYLQLKCIKILITSAISQYFNYC